MYYIKGSNLYYISSSNKYAMKQWIITIYLPSRAYTFDYPYPIKIHKGIFHRQSSIDMVKITEDKMV